MNVSLFFGYLSIILVYLSQYNRFKFCFPLAYLILAVFLGIRYDWGNDYWGYYNKFQIICAQVNNWSELIQFSSEKGEIGWVLICLIFKPIGFSGMLFVLSFIQNLILYKTIKTYVPLKYCWVSTAIYVLNPIFMVTGVSMMRQWLAMCLLLFLVRFIYAKKFLKYFFGIMLISTIHSSAIMFLPCYFFCKIDLNSFSVKSKILFFICFLIFAIIGFYGFHRLVLPILDMLGLEAYVVYVEEAVQVSIGSVFLFYLFMGLCSLFIKNSNYYLSILICFYFVGLVFQVISLNASLISRMAYYGLFFSIFVYPYIMEYFRKRKILYISILLFIVCGYTYLLVDFFKSDLWFDSMMHYKTIFVSNS